MYSYYVTIDDGSVPVDSVAAVVVDAAVRRALRGIGEDQPGWHIAAARDRRIVSEVRPG